MREKMTNGSVEVEALGTVEGDVAHERALVTRPREHGKRDGDGHVDADLPKRDQNQSMPETGVKVRGNGKHLADVDLLLELAREPA